MVDDPNREAVIEALRSEIAALRISSEALLFAFDRTMNFALVFVIGGFGISFTKGFSLMLAFIPFPVVLIVGYLLGLNAEGLSRAGHKRYLEERLNSVIGVVCIEEEFVAPSRQGHARFGRLSVAMLQLLMGMMLIGLLVAGFLAVWRDAHDYWPLYLVCAIYSSIALVAAVKELSTAYQKAYDAAKASAHGIHLTDGGQLHGARASNSGRPAPSSTSRWSFLRWRR